MLQILHRPDHVGVTLKPFFPCRTLLASCCHIRPVRVDLTGSLQRGTAISGDFDIDVRVELQSQDWPSLRLLKQEAKQRLTSQGFAFLSEGEHILKLRLTTGPTKAPVDLVFTSSANAGSKEQLESQDFDADSGKWSDYTLAFRAYFGLKNDARLIEAYERLSKQGHHVKELILLTKHWKKQEEAKVEKEGRIQDAKRLGWVKSIHLELACLTAAEEMPAGQGFHMSFGRVLTLLARGLNNSALARQLAMEPSYLGLREAERAVLRAHARQSLKKMCFAFPGKGDSQDLFMFLRPSEVRFTQQKCSPTFSDRHGHGSVHIGDTAGRICSGRILSKAYEGRSKLHSEVEASPKIPKIEAGLGFRV